MLVKVEKAVKVEPTTFKTKTMRVGADMEILHLHVQLMSPFKPCIPPFPFRPGR